MGEDRALELHNHTINCGSKIMDAVPAAKCHLRCYYDIVTYRLAVWNHDDLSISKYLSIAHCS